MSFARWTFRIAGILGLIALIPQYFLESKLAEDMPPAITHPEFFYGFTGVAIAWQVAFIIISLDPVRYRLFMLPSMIEKFSYGGCILVLFLMDRVTAPQMLTAGFFDTVLGILFVVSWFKTAGET